MIKVDKIDSTLAAIALKGALMKDTHLHDNLVKYNVKDIDNALLRAEMHLKLESIQKSKPVVSVVIISHVPSRIDDSRRL